MSKAYLVSYIDRYNDVLTTELVTCCDDEERVSWHTRRRLENHEGLYLGVTGFCITETNEYIREVGM